MLEFQIQEIRSNVTQSAKLRLFYPEDGVIVDIKNTRIQLPLNINGNDTSDTGLQSIRGDNSNVKVQSISVLIPLCD